MEREKGNIDIFHFVLWCPSLFNSSQSRAGTGGYLWHLSRDSLDRDKNRRRYGLALKSYGGKNGPSRTRNWFSIIMRKLNFVETNPCHFAVPFPENLEKKILNK